MSLQPTPAPGLSGRFSFVFYGMRSVMLLLGVLLLSSCGLGEKLSGKNDSGTTATTEAGEASAPIPPLAAPAKPGEVGTAFTPDGLPALQPLGVNVDKLFAERIKDEDKRFERVENAVLELRKEFDAVKPAIVRLVAVQNDMQDLVAQLHTLLTNEPAPREDAVTVETEPLAAAPPQDGKKAPATVTAAPPPPAAQSPPLPAALTPPATPPPEIAAAPPPPAVVPSAAPKQEASGGRPVSAGAAGAQVRALRIGEHEDKTRLVFDVAGPVSYRYDIDNGEKIMIVELPGAGWAGQTQWTSAKAPLLASYTVTPSDGGGSRVVIQLKQAASAVYETTIAGGPGEAFRIVIDLRRQ